MFLFRGSGCRSLLFRCLLLALHIWATGLNTTPHCFQWYCSIPGLKVCRFHSDTLTLNLNSQLLQPSLCFFLILSALIIDRFSFFGLTHCSCPSSSSPTFLCPHPFAKVTWSLSLTCVWLTPFPVCYLSLSYPCFNLPRWSRNKGWSDLQKPGNFYSPFFNMNLVFKQQIWIQHRI